MSLLSMMRLMVPFRSSRPSARTCSVRARSCRFAPPSGPVRGLDRLTAVGCAPAADLLRVDVHELQLLGMNLLAPVDGGVVEHMRGHCQFNGLWCLSGRWRRWRHDARARLLSPTPGIQISDTEFAALNIQPANFHGEWNYT